MAKKFGYNKYRLKLAQILLPPANEVCQGYVFTRECHSVHGKGVVSKRALQISRPTPTGRLRGHARGSPGPHPGGFSRLTPGGVSRPTPRGVCIPACTEADTPLPPADGYCCGWYASYWNAFLLIKYLLQAETQEHQK